MQIVHLPTFTEFPWWVIWPVDSQTPGNYYRLKQKYMTWGEERGTPIMDRSIYHVDTSLRYAGFQTEMDAFQFVLVFSGDIAK
jgi:hypothetical protein